MGMFKYLLYSFNATWMTFMHKHHIQNGFWVYRLFSRLVLTRIRTLHFSWIPHDFIVFHVEMSNSDFLEVMKNRWATDCYRIKF